MEEGNTLNETYNFVMASVKNEAVNSDEKAEDTGGMHGSTEQAAGGGVPTEERPKRRLSTKGVRRPGYKRRVNAPHSYVELITMAIKACTRGMLTLGEILAHLRENNECFQGPYHGWKNSVRHTLSSSPCFVKMLRNSNRPHAKDNFWAMNSDCSCPHSNKEPGDTDQKRESPMRLNEEEASSTPQTMPLAPLPLSQPQALLPFSQPQVLQLFAQGVLPQLSPAFHNHQLGPEPRLYIADEMTPSSTHDAQDSASPSPVFNTPPSPVFNSQPPDVSPAPSPVLDNAVQSVPLDLSLPKKRNHSQHDQKSAPSQSRKKHKSAASRCSPALSESSSESTFSKELKNHMSLPVSRFLSCSDTDTPCTIFHGAKDMDGEQNTPDSHGQIPRTVLPFQPPINPWYTMVPPKYIPKTTEEWLMLRHYWERVMAHKGALYRQHLARLEELRAKQAENHHEYPPISYIPSGVTSQAYTSVPPYTLGNSMSPAVYQHGYQYNLQMTSHTV